MQTVLTIAGFDPSSGAGITADLMAFAAHGLFGTSAITAHTVQSTLGVEALQPIDPGLLRDTLACLATDLPAAGVKIGMVSSQSNVLIISGYIKHMHVSLQVPAHPPTVLDPVLVSSSGRQLLDREGFGVLCNELLPLVDWITPNAGELATLSGLEVKDRESLAHAARTLQARLGAGRQNPRTGRGAAAIGILAKAGHLDKPDDLLLMPDGEEHWLTGERIDTDSTHGTGCALSSAFLSRLVLGDAPPVAAIEAKNYVATAMRRAPGLGHGKGPLDLLWPLRVSKGR